MGEGTETDRGKEPARQKAAPKADARAERLKAALKANVARRKAQAEKRQSETRE